MKMCMLILLMLVYGLSSTGMTLQVHYCCGKIKKVDWLSAPEKKCGNEHKMGSLPCCETKQVTIKAGSDYFKNDFFYKDGKMFSLALLPNHQAKEKVTLRDIIRPVLFPSPLISSPPLFLLNGVFRI